MSFDGLSFDTAPFWGFVLGVWLLWALARHNGARKIILTVASYAFYATWNLAYLPLLAGLEFMPCILHEA